MVTRLAQLLAVVCLAVLAVGPARGAGSAAAARASGCAGASEFAYAGLQASTKAHGVAATLVPTQAPTVIDGHVGGWVGVGGTQAGPGGVAEWLQVGLSAYSGEDGSRSRMYYEVTLPGASPKYVELEPDVRPGTKRRVAVVEMATRKSFWRVWVNGKPVSPPIHLPGSHGAWYPQIVGENWNGGTGACNGFTYSFSDVRLAHAQGGKWRPLGDSYLFQDRGYKVIRAADETSSFVATSI